MTDFEKLAEQFMGNMLANPTIDEIPAESETEFYEILAKKAIMAAHIFRKEMKAAKMNAEDAIIVE